MSASASRKHRRHDPNSKPKYSLHDVQRASNIALEMKRLTKGHLFSKTIDSRCVFCGVKNKGKKDCKFWFFTFLDRMQVVLINPDFYKEDEIEAFWLYASKEYADVRVPFNVKGNDA